MKRPVPPQLVEQVIDAAIRAGLAHGRRRSLLLVGLKSDLAAQLPDKEVPAEQLRSDVHFLANGRHQSVEPLGCWLANAFRLAPDEIVFAQALQTLGLTVPPRPSEPPDLDDGVDRLVQDRVTGGATGAEVAGGARRPVHIEQGEVSGVGTVGARFGGEPATGRPMVVTVNVSGEGTGVVINEAERAVPPLSSLLVPGIARLPRGTITPSQLLIARHRVVPFAGRVAELAELDRWADDDDAEVAVRLVHAGGGAGKTRLAQEWIRRRRKAGKCAGFLPGELTDEVIASVLAADDADIVLDYAESRAHLAALMTKLARRWQEEAPGRIRVVLLARNAGDWWQVLKQSSDDVADLLADSPAALDLPPLVAPAQRGVEFRRALTAFGKKVQGSTALTDGAGWTDSVPTLDLTDPRFGRTLYLHAAALMAGLGERVTAADVLDRVLDHETRIWLRRADFAGPRQTRDAAQVFKTAAQGVIAAVTLRGGADSKQSLEALTEHVAGAGHAHLSRMVAQLYPGEGADFAAPLEPDLLGETLVVRTLESREHGLSWLDLATANVSTKWPTVFIVLGRAEVHGPEVVRAAEAHLLREDLATRAAPAFDGLLALATRTAHAGLGQVLADALSARGDMSVAQALAPRLPEHSVMLREVSAWVTQTLASGGGDDEQRARHLNNLGVRLSALGRREEALAATREAVDIRRQLAHARPDAFLPDLAMALSNLGMMLSGLGRREEALAATREAVDIYRKLALARPDAFLPKLAETVSVHGDVLAALNHDVEARAAADEALDILWPFFLKLPAAHARWAGMLLKDCLQRSGAEPSSQLAERLRQYATLTEATD